MAGGMTKLENLQANAAVRGILPDSLVTVVSVQWFGSEALELTYKSPDGKVANQLLYRHDEPRLEVVEQGRPWSFDGDGALKASRSRDLGEPLVSGCARAGIASYLPAEIGLVTLRGGGRSSRALRRAALIRFSIRPWKFIHSPMLRSHTGTKCLPYTGRAPALGATTSQISEGISVWASNGA